MSDPARRPPPLPATIVDGPGAAPPATASEGAARGYRAAADAPETLRAYRADLACFRAGMGASIGLVQRRWCSASPPAP
jgi:hypothetical protein